MRGVDWLVAAGLGLVVAVAAALVVLPAVMVISAVALAVLMLSMHRRVRQGQREQLRATTDATNQTAALLSIFATIRPTTPLPPMGGWAASPDLLRLLLEVLVRERPQVVLEASSGVSTLILAYGLRDAVPGGRVYVLEHDPMHAARTRRAIESAGLTDLAVVIDAPLVEHQLGGATWQWYDLTNLPETLRAGLLVVDGPPGTIQAMARYPALPLLQDRLAPTATVVMDDTRRRDERAVADRWAVEFPGWSLEFQETEKGAAILRRSATER